MTSVSTANRISKPANRASGKLNRETFRASRLLDFCSRKELIAQTGHQERDWPRVVVKELLDNSLDACEEHGTAPVIKIAVDESSITVSDNGPGIPADTVSGILDFSSRTSSREAYVSPTRGAQGNALKTLVAMPFVLDGESGTAEIVAQGTRHIITMSVDRIQQTPVFDHQQHPEKRENGTSVKIHWPDSPRSNELNGKTRILQNDDEDDEDEEHDSPNDSPRLNDDAKSRFLQFADDYTFLNPHLSLTLNWRGEETTIKATDPAWSKWLPSYPTSPHWYQNEHFERLIGNYLANGKDRTVREFVSEFRGFKGSAAQKTILELTGLARSDLSELAKGRDLDKPTIAKLLDVMKKASTPVKPAALGIIGKDHFAKRFELMGAAMKSFKYRKVTGEKDGLPWIIETAFAYCPEQERRRLVTGVNWSPGILNPFREMGKYGQSLDSVLEKLYVGRNEPVTTVLHLTCPRVNYTDRGKSAVVIEG